MPTRHGWLTPNNGATETLCRALIIPLDDNLQFLQAVNGALYDLTQPYNWEQFGDMTAQEAADVMRLVYDTYVTGCAGGSCEVLSDPDLGIDIIIKIIRRNSAGFTEQLINDEWTTPEGDYEVPAIPSRSESTADERMCLAAINVASVIEQVYEEATDAYNISATQAAVFSAIFDIAITLVGTFAGPTAASYASFGKTAFDAFYEVVETLASDVWPGSFTDDLACFLLQFATDTASVVTFDWAAARAGILTNFLNAAGAFSAADALLWGQVGYLFDILAAGGIDTAGSTTGVTSYDCSACLFGCEFSTIFPGGVMPGNLTLLEGQFSTTLGVNTGDGAIGTTVFNAGSGTQNVRAEVDLGRPCNIGELTATGRKTSFNTAAFAIYANLYDEFHVEQHHLVLIGNGTSNYTVYQGKSNSAGWSDIRYVEFFGQVTNGGGMLLGALAVHE